MDVNEFFLAKNSFMAYNIKCNFTDIYTYIYIYIYFQKVSKTGGVDRMTDTSKYTGSHKERFDESGKGKGIEGREDRVENKGYVSSYKGEGSYDSKTGK